MLAGLLAAHREDELTKIKQSIQDEQVNNLSLEEVEHLLQQIGKLDAAKQLKDELRKGIHLLVEEF